MFEIINALSLVLINRFSIDPTPVQMSIFRILKVFVCTLSSVHTFNSTRIEVFSHISHRL